MAIAPLAGHPAYPAVHVTVLKDEDLRHVAKLTLAITGQAVMSAVPDIAVSDDELDSHPEPPLVTVSDIRHATPTQAAGHAL
jgi:hypothetical protein